RNVPTLLYSSLLPYIPFVQPERRSFPTRRSSDRQGGGGDDRAPLHGVLSPAPAIVAPCAQIVEASSPSVPGERRSVWLTWTRDQIGRTRLNSSHVAISYAVFCLKKKKLSNSALAL